MISQSITGIVKLKSSHYKLLWLYIQALQGYSIAGKALYDRAVYLDAPDNTIKSVLDNVYKYFDPIDDSLRLFPVFAVIS